ncbi:MAG: DUF4832 domain-containing protein [Butyrivibrio sp.]|uniref:DUF4832 domain-containing protein n=1 Tax=Butyrivibrio sp. TaxID=28121 RepID=UPI0025D186C8|nr:DUF4832 domain-containing protein [Butyrivibrio sp.]MCR5770542.1 DUF4832 domain-containing protein [Butyrivibrio sp.]
MIKDVITNIILVILIILTIVVFIMLFGDDLGIHIDVGEIIDSISEKFQSSDEEEETEDSSESADAASVSSTQEEEVVTVASMYDNTVTIEYELSDEVLYNPLMGYAPSADSDDEVDVDIDKTRLVYIEITWAELEPEQGVYDFESIEEKNNLEEWRSAGKNAVLRFICDDPSDEKHMDIPEWVYKMTKDGKYYDTSYGMGYCPDYSNEDFIEAHNEAVKALGEYFSGDSFVRYVELGSLGHWGEWHVNTDEDEDLPNIPETSVRTLYVNAYEEAFPNAKLLMRRPFTELPEGGGVFNDMVGDYDDTQTWLEWIEEGGEYDQTGEEDGLSAVPEIWNTAPVGGEFTSSIEMEEMLIDSYDTTSDLIKDSHMTFIGPKVPDANAISGAAALRGDEILKYLGYRYAVTKMEYGGDDTQSYIGLNVSNEGIAPIYWDYPMYLYLKDQAGNIEKYELDIDLTSLYGGESEYVMTSVPVAFDDLSNYRIMVSIEDPETNEPAVYIATNATRSGYMTILL